MADGAQEQAWNHTSAIVAMIAEVNRDSKRRSRPFTATEFHPYHGKKFSRGIRLKTGNLHILKSVFVDRKAT